MKSSTSASRVRSATPLPMGLLAQLDYAVLERRPDGTFTMIGSPPVWLPRLWPETATPSETLRPARAFLFLAHFMEEATVFWERGAGKVLASGPWTEVDREGREWVLEARAMRCDGRAFLLLSFPTTDFETVRRLLQENREQSLQRHRLLKEVDKREVLLHCIIHDLSTPLASIKGSLSLMKQDALVREDGEGLLRIGLNQVEKMQALIRSILTTFAHEVQPLLPTLVAEANAPDLAVHMAEVAQAMEAVAALKGVRLRLEIPPSSWKVVAEAVRLERVLFNLVENALRHTTPGSEVVLRLREEGAFVRACVEDDGPGVPENLVPALFEKYAQGTEHTGKTGLGLYFCRITVEDWGGAIGYDRARSGGACFWFRLPKPS